MPAFEMTSSVCYLQSGEKQGNLNVPYDFGTRGADFVDIGGRVFTRVYRETIR